MLGSQKVYRYRSSDAKDQEAILRLKLRGKIDKASDVGSVRVSGNSRLLGGTDVSRTVHRVCLKACIAVPSHHRITQSTSGANVLVLRSPSGSTGHTPLNLQQKRYPVVVSKP